MRLTPTSLPEVLLLAPQVFADERGSLLELYAERQLRDAGIDGAFVQANRSLSRAYVLRGLHYQLQPPQAKLVVVTRGRILDVAVDIRRSSPRFGRHAATELRAGEPRQLYIPAGFAHGFFAHEESEVLYLLSGPYTPATEHGLRWDDPSLGIAWPSPRPLLSPRDAAQPLLAAIPPDRLPP